MRCSYLYEVRVIVVDAELVAETGHVGRQIRWTKLPDLVCSHPGLDDGLLPWLENRRVVMPVRCSVLLEYDRFVGLCAVLV